MFLSLSCEDLGVLFLVYFGHRVSLNQHRYMLNTLDDALTVIKQTHDPRVVRFTINRNAKYGDDLSLRNLNCSLI